MDWICECDSYDEDHNNVVFMASSIYETRVRVIADMVLYCLLYTSDAADE